MFGGHSLNSFEVNQNQLFREGLRRAQKPPGLNGLSNKPRLAMGSYFKN